MEFSILLGCSVYHVQGLLFSLLFVVNNQYNMMVKLNPLQV